MKKAFLILLLALNIIIGVAQNYNFTIKEMVTRTPQGYETWFKLRTSSVISIENDSIIKMNGNVIYKVTNFWEEAGVTYYDLYDVANGRYCSGQFYTNPMRLVAVFSEGKIFYGPSF